MRVLIAYPIYKVLLMTCSLLTVLPWYMRKIWCWCPGELHFDEQTISQVVCNCKNHIAHKRVLQKFVLKALCNVNKEKKKKCVAFCCWNEFLQTCKVLHEGVERAATVKPWQFRTGWFAVQDKNSMIFVLPQLKITYYARRIALKMKLQFRLFVLVWEKLSGKMSAVFYWFTAVVLVWS